MGGPEIIHALSNQLSLSPSSHGPPSFTFVVGEGERETGMGGGTLGELAGVRRGRGEKGVEGIVGFLKAITIINENKDKKHLSLSKLSLTSLPAFLTTCPHLTSLDLSKNYLSRLPSFLSRLSHLRNIDLRGNPLVVPVPKSIPIRKYLRFVTEKK